MRSTITVLLLLLLVAPLSSWAQVSVGLQGNTIFSWIDHKDDGDAIQDHAPRTSTLTGFGFGILVDVPLGAKFHLQPELAFRQKGYEQAVMTAYGPGDEEFAWRYDYLDLGCLLRFHPGGAPNGLFFLAGPSFNRLLGMRVRSEEVTPFQPDYPLSWQSGPVQALDPEWLGFALIDIALNLGVGGYIELGGSRFMAEVRYQHGLENVAQGFMVRDINGALIGELNTYNRAVLLNVAWLLPVGVWHE